MNCFAFAPAGSVSPQIAVPIAIQVASGVGSCEEGQLVALTSAEYKNLFSPENMGIGSSEILHVYAWGLGSILAMWALGYVVALSLGLIKKI